MSLLRHVIFALCYGTVAVVAALTLPYSVAGIDKITAVAIGAVILIFGAVIHEVYARQERERGFRRELHELTAARDSVEGELDRARREIRVIKSRMGVAPALDGSPDQVAVELRILQGLVGQLAGGPAVQRPPTPTTAQRPRSADSLTEADVVELLHDAVRHDRIDILLQPIVSLPQRKPRLYECTSRVRAADGTALGAVQYLALAEREGLITAIDNLLLFRCIQLIRATQRRHRTVGFFASLSPHSLRDEAFMAQFVEFMADNTVLAPYLVFEFRMADLPQVLGALRPPLDRLAALGARFSLAGVRQLALLDVDKLARHHIRFLKIEAETLLREVDGAPGGGAPAVDIRALKAELDRAAIDLIVSRVDSEKMLLDLLDLPIDFGQGLLFGEPRPAGTV